MIVSYNPYYQDISSTATFTYSTTNSNTIDLRDIGDQQEDRDNSLTLTLYVEDHPEDITIELEDVQKVGEDPITQINLGEKPKNSELTLTITNIPSGLYNLNIYSSKGYGLQKNISVSKYDNGQTFSNEISSDFSDKTTIIITFGKLKFTGSFTNNIANLSDLDQVKKRRRRGGGASLSTTGSLTLSSGTNNMGN